MAWVECRLVACGMSVHGPSLWQRNGFGLVSPLRPSVGVFFEKFP
jgi:hypothetical protein